MQQLDQGVERLIDPRPLVLRVDADPIRVLHQGARPHAEHDAPARHVIELHHAVGQDERVVIRQGYDAGAEPDVPGAFGRRGNENLGRGDDLEAARMMLADPGLRVVEAVQMLEQLHVAADGERRVLVEIVERRQEDAATKVARAHAVVSLFSKRILRGRGAYRYPAGYGLVRLATFAYGCRPPVSERGRTA